VGKKREMLCTLLTDLNLKERGKVCLIFNNHKGEVGWRRRRNMRLMIAGIHYLAIQKNKNEVK
jgi:hypothetical protein